MANADEQPAAPEALEKNAASEPPMQGKGGLRWAMLQPESWDSSRSA
jgi:hypothetical protein